MHILIVEDDEILLEGLTSGLALKGFTTDAVASAGDADVAVAASDYDAIVLDVALPDGSGLDLLKRWRSANMTVPILLLTARNATSDRISGLDSGADDYLGKPFDLNELAARLRAIGRRARGLAAGKLDWRNISLDPAQREVVKGGEAIDLSRREFDLFHILLAQRGRVLTRAQLEDGLYGWTAEVGSNAVEVHVHNIRAKLGRDTIETVRGIGYRLPAL